MVGILFGRRAMYHTVQHQLIHPGQGGRIGGECEDVALTKVLHISMSHLTKTALGIFESDAASCFDRIIMRFAFHCFKTLGAPLSPMAMWEDALYNVRHSIKTGYGESTGTYHFTTESPIHGPGQGSRGGVTSICALSTILLRAFDTIGKGAFFCSPVQDLHYKGIAQMYFDDTTNYFNDFIRWLQRLPSPEQLAGGLQEDAQRWERLLYTSGGALRAPKCFFYLLNWTFDDQEQGSLLPPDEETELLFLTSGNDAREHPIRQMEPSDTHRTLGVHLSADFNMATSLRRLTEHIETYVTCLLTSGLSKQDTAVAYFLCFIPKVLYGLALMTHTRKDLERIQKPAISATLAKMGFRRTIHRSIVYGALQYGGLGL
eukprot:scaffold1608_cov91-Cylindrotheca_fusiformis.AAC.2